MRPLRRVLVLFLSFALAVFAEGNTFDRVRYNGGSVNSKVDPHEWHNTLIITSDVITLALKDGTRVDIPPKSVISISYGQEAHRRVGTMVALAILVAPIALFGLFAKTRLHFIGIQYTTPDKKSAGILLQGDKDNYRAILVALQGVTGVPVSVAEKEREFVPVSVRTEVTKTALPEPEHSQAPVGNAAQTSSAANAPLNAGGTGTAPMPDQSSQTQPSQAQCTVVISSNPGGADVFVDDDFAGNTPSTITIPTGKHVIAVKKSGFQDWVRRANLYGGSATLNAELTPTTNAVHTPNPPIASDTSREMVAVAAPTNSSQQPIGWIGIHAQNKGDAAVVTNVAPDSPGAMAGLQVGDIILALDGRLIKGKDFETTVSALKPGTRISVNYARGSSAHEVWITVASHQ
jgi:hypothetical protein